MDDVDRTRRQLTPAELGILRRLLTTPFPGCSELRAQLPHTWVTGTCPCGCPSIALTVNRPRIASALVRRPIPVEGRTRDRDGTEVVVLLHTRDGYLAELELYRIVWAPFASPEPDSVVARLPAYAANCS